MFTPPKHTLLIVGSGIAGPTLALTILAHPTLSALYRPHLLDRLPAASAYYAGAAVVLSSNALYPLIQLGLKDALWAISSPALNTKIYRTSNPVSTPGRYLNQIQNPNWSPDLQTSLRAVERGKLMKILVDAVEARGGEVSWGSKVVGVEQTPCGVDVLLEGGERVGGAMVVGADGGWSAVRKHLVGEQGDWKPGFANASGVYGISRRPEGATDEEVDGKGAVVLLDVGGVSTWALPGGKQWWSMTLLETSPPSEKSEIVDHPEFGQITTGGYSLSSTIDALKRAEKVWYPSTGDCGTLFRSSEKIVRVPLYHRVFSASQIANAADGGEGNIVLVGDAARIMVPTSGQGACFSIEDSTILATALLNHPPSTSTSLSDNTSKLSFTAALTEYTTLRIPRSTSIAKQSYWTGVGFMAETWWWRWFRDFIVKWGPMGGDPKERMEKGERVRDPMQWLYEVRLEVKVKEKKGWCE